MARKITMFELHVDGVQIGPARLGRRSNEGADGEREGKGLAEDTEGARPETRSARSVPRVLTAIGGVAIGVVVGRRLVRRVRGDGQDIEIEAVDRAKADAEAQVAD